MSLNIKCHSAGYIRILGIFPNISYISSGSLWEFYVYLAKRSDWLTRLTFVNKPVVLQSKGTVAFGALPFVVTAVAEASLIVLHPCQKKAAED